MSNLLQYAIDVVEGIKATVDGGVYNLVSHTPVNPLLLDQTAMNLLEQQAGTTLSAVVNDAGETVGYIANGVAKGGNGAASDVSTYVNVLTRETVVDAEMAAGTYIEASTGEVASLTVGETVTEISAAGSGAGILAMEIPAAGAAIAVALGLAGGFALYNIAPGFWGTVADQLLAAGELVNGRVQSLFNSNGDTSFSEDAIEVYKEAFRKAGFFDQSNIISTDDPDLTLKNLVKQPFYAEEDMNKEYKYYMDKNHEREITLQVPNDIKTNCSRYAMFYEESPRPGQPLKYYFVGANSQRPTYYDRDFTYDERKAYGLASGGTGAANYGLQTMANELPSNVTTTALADDNDVMNHLTWLLAYSTLARSERTQEDATLPTDDPFTETYPDWAPNNNIQGKDYYPASMPTDKGKQAPSQTGQNEEDEEKDIITDILFNPDPIPSPTTYPELDPQPTPQQDTAPEDPTPVNDPTDPNPGPLPSDPSPILPIIAGISASKMTTIYNPTDGEVNSLGAFLWVSNIIEQIKLIFQDPLDGIISLHKIYAQPVTGSTKSIVLGYIDSGVSALEVTNQFTTVDCGSVAISETRHNATDYPPYTKAHIYLPFIGIEELDVSEIMGGTVSVQYRVDAYTGTCVAQIFVTRTGDMSAGQMLYTFSGNASQSLPLTSGNFTGLMGSLVSIAGGAVIGGVGGAVLAGAASGLTSHAASVSHSGNISANAGIMGPRKPYIILTRQRGYDANGYAGLHGYPVNKTVYLSNCTGYLKVKDVLYRGDGTENEKKEIVELLKAGVIV